MSNKLRSLPSQTYLFDWAHLIVSASAEAFPLKAAVGNNIFTSFDDTFHLLQKELLGCDIFLVMVFKTNINQQNRSTLKQGAWIKKEPKTKLHQFHLNMTI